MIPPRLFLLVGALATVAASAVCHATVPELPFSRTLPENPDTAEIAAFRVFSEPLWPVGGVPAAAENAALESVLRDFAALEPFSEGIIGLLEDLEGYLAAHPNSPWNPTLRLNLGLIYYREGYFSRALDAFETAWSALETETHPRAKGLADRAIGEFLLLNSKLGRFETMEGFFAQLETRPIGGVATELVAGARMGLHTMHVRPEIAFRCGPMALDRIYARFDPLRPNREVILAAESTQQGTSLWRNQQWADEAGIPLRPAQRSTGAVIPLPALVHWKSGHFAAITDYRNGRYHVEDGTFHDALWVTLDAIEDEASGYFLVPDDGGPLPSGWSRLVQGTAENVWGRGYVFGYETDDIGPGDHSVGCGGSGRGMAVWNIHLLAVSLNILDTPVAYQPPVGLPVAFTVRYNQRDLNQPSVFAYPNLGPKWTFDWISAIIDNPSQPYGAVKHYLSGGGAEPYEYFTSTGPETGFFPRQRKSRNLLERTGSDSYRLTHPDGTVDLFDHSDGVTASQRRIFLTLRTDPQGNTREFVYDSQFRLHKVRDALGQETELFYDHPTDSLKITKVRDPFGREASMEYDAQGRLSKITDPEGIESVFTYAGTGPNTDFIEKLTTPYGETLFDYGEVADDFWGYDTIRWLEVVDPMGLKRRVEYRPAAPGISPDEFPVPWPGSESVTSSLDGVIGIRGYDTPLHTRYWRNTFYWDPRAMREMADLSELDYSKAHIYQWLHSSDWHRSESILESEKPPLEHRIYYNYQGQSNPTVVGPTALVSKIARAMDDNGPSLGMGISFNEVTLEEVVIPMTTGISQISQFAYNDLGFRTRAIDPVGRETEFIYAPNDIDLIEVRQKVGSNWETLVVFDGYVDHRPGTQTGGSGETGTYTWNSRGQLLTFTNPRSETVVYTYDHRLDFDPLQDTPSGYGYLYRIDGPVSGAHLIFTYDAAGRVRSVTDSEGHVRTFDYDDLDRLTRITYPDATFEERTYHRLDLASYTDREGRTTTFLHNGNRQLMVETDPEGRITQYDYCSCGAVNRLIDPNGNTTRWRYDLQGRVTRKIYPDGSEVQYIYDPHNGRLTAITDALGQTTEYVYHLDDTLDTITYTGAIHPTPSVSYGWDPHFLRLSTLTDGAGVTTWTYHPFDGQTPGAGRLATVSGPLPDSVIEYSYDQLGRRTGRTINGAANVAARDFDSLGRLAWEENNLGLFTYHPLNQTNQISSIDLPGGQSTHFSYRPNHEDRRLERMEHRRADQSVHAAHLFQYTADGIINQWTRERSGMVDQTWHFGYDSANQLTGAVRKDPSETVMEERTWHYDRAGNRIAEEKDGNGLIPVRYNGLNQLTEHGTGPVRFAGTIDEPGQVWVAGHEAKMRHQTEFEAWLELPPGIHEVEITAEDYSENSITRFYEVSIGYAGQTFLTHDLSGNLVTRETATETTHYEWDAENRLIAVERVGQTRSEFTYDGLWRRVRIVEKEWDELTETWQPTADRRFLWDGLAIAEERSGTNGGTVDKRFYSQGVEIVTGSSAGTYTYRTDHLGSIREVVDDQGALVARYEYSLWGEIETVSGSFDLDFGFTGHFIHHPTGLHLAPFRAYDATTGRWISRDPLGYAEFLPEGPNLYGYVGNNPILYWDPFGLATWWNPFTWGADEWGAAGQGAYQGNAAFWDGVNPFGNWFSGQYNECDTAVQWSRIIGGTTRDVSVFLATAGSWQALGLSVRGSLGLSSLGLTPLGAVATSGLSTVGSVTSGLTTISATMYLRYETARQVFDQY